MTLKRDQKIFMTLKTTPKKFVTAVIPSRLACLLKRTTPYLKNSRKCHGRKLSRKSTVFIFVRKSQDFFIISITTIRLNPYIIHCRSPWNKFVAVSENARHPMTDKCLIPNHKLEWHNNCLRVVTCSKKLRIFADTNFRG